MGWAGELFWQKPKSKSNVLFGRESMQSKAFSNGFISHPWLVLEAITAITVLFGTRREVVPPCPAQPLWIWSENLAGTFEA